MAWYLNRKVEYYPFDIYLAGQGYTGEMKEDFGWVFKNIFFYYTDGVAYSYRSVSDFKSLRLYFEKKFNDQLVDNLGSLIKKRSTRLLTVTQKTFKSTADFKVNFSDFCQTFRGLFAIFQLPELAQVVSINADQQLIKRFGLARDFAARQVVLAEKIWRTRLGKMVGLTNQQALMLLPFEISNIIEGSALPPDLKKRRQAAIIFTNGEVDVLWNRKADRFFKKEIKNFDKNVPTVLTGQPAYPGLISGRAFTALKLADFKKIPKGAILICSTTRYNIVQYLNRVKAVVADQGGITSHASIICRELKKPCVVGAKYATDCFKDGDMILVDAKKGIVRKI